MKIRRKLKELRTQDLSIDKWIEPTIIVLFDYIYQETFSCTFIFMQNEITNLIKEVTGTS